MDDYSKLKKLLKQFSEDRDWDQFHTPKNLAAALSVEAAELLEIFQWLNDAEAINSPNDPKIKGKAKEELADILTYLIRLADKMDIDLFQAAFEKLEQSAQKYPVAKAKGNAKKYSEL